MIAEYDMLKSGDCQKHSEKLSFLKSMIITIINFNT